MIINKGINGTNGTLIKRQSAINAINAMHKTTRIDGRGGKGLR